MEYFGFSVIIYSDGSYIYSKHASTGSITDINKSDIYNQFYSSGAPLKSDSEEK